MRFSTEHYALIFVGKQASDYYNYQNWLVWSREPYLSSEYLQYVDEYLYKLGVHFKFMYWVKQGKGCDYFSE